MTTLEYCDTRFIQQGRDYTQQYSKIYYQRFVKLKQAMQQTLTTVTIPMMRESVLQVVPGELCTIIGTVFKQMPLKPSALKDLTLDRSNAPVPPRRSYASENDTLYIEDTNGRIEVQGSDDNVKAHIAELVTGVVAAFVGVSGDNGVFITSQIIHIGAANQDPLPNNDDKYVLIVSGLNLGKDDCSPAESQMMVDMVSSAVSTDVQICHVIIAGNSIYNEPRSARVSITTGREYAPSEGVSVMATRRLDNMIAQMCGNVNVDLMPGPCDPSTFILPQQPMHLLMFPISRGFHSRTFHTVPNPHAIVINGVSILGCSGQNIDDMMLYQSLEVLDRIGGTEEEMTTRMRLTCNTLRDRHLAPSAPDTLGCYPFTNIDPFLITTTPHVYFVGNQPEYKTQLYNENGVSCRVILVPTYYKTHQAVLVNLKTLESSMISFNIKNNENNDKME